MLYTQKLHIIVSIVHIEKQNRMCINRTKNNGKDVYNGPCVVVESLKKALFKRRDYNIRFRRI